MRGHSCRISRPRQERKRGLVLHDSGRETETALVHHATLVRSNACSTSCARALILRNSSLALPESPAVATAAEILAARSARAVRSLARSREKSSESSTRAGGQLALRMLASRTRLRTTAMISLVRRSALQSHYRRQKLTTKPVSPTCAILTQRSEGVVHVLNQILIHHRSLPRAGARGVPWFRSSGGGTEGGILL